MINDKCHLRARAATTTGSVNIIFVMFIEEQFILLSIGLATIILRMYIRWRQVGVSGWQLDDYLMPLTGVSIKPPLPHYIGKI